MADDPVTPSDLSFSPFAVSVLRAADRRMRSSDRGDMMTRYAACRAAMCALTRVDTFYVGHYIGKTTLSIPYCVDNKQFLSADVQQFGPNGLSEYIRSTGQIYRFGQDGGRRARMGWKTTENPVMDVVVVPLRHSETEEVLGMMCVESTVAGTYDDEIVRALQWLAKALVWEMTQDRSFADDLGLYELYPELDSTRPRDETEMLRTLTGELERLRLALRAIDLPDDPKLAEATRLIEDAKACGERLHMRLADTLATTHPDDPALKDNTAGLTTRELEIATLIAVDGLTNRELAERLFISEKTVKVHVGNVLRKLGIAQRSAIAYVIGAIHPSASPKEQ
ncbi:response regulator transcription factor [Flexivirga oryzae]|uniref:DNA-binding CsgD family transcriptional regulator n=1 Tax=Flexivirga oryzae TaxID=1794944 RepID=A0A839N3P8_9MICO|nr:DNA-binding CsgD family transcriptional regulator [Flexivirga oryzae]